MDLETRICLVRHGVTAWNLDGRVQGRSDLPLAPEGERQSTAVADRLAAETWDAIYSSPLQRACQTAQIIARRIGQQRVMTDPRLMERTMGEAEGMADIEVAARWPGLPWDEIPGMEPAGAVADRAREALREIAERHPGGRVICVAHGSLISQFLRSLTPPGSGANHHLQPTSVAVVCCDGRRFALERPPDHRHLLLDGIEYSGEKGRLSGTELARLSQDGLPGAEALESLIWKAAAVEAAWDGDELVGFAQVVTDGAPTGRIDLVVALPGYAHLRPVLIDRLQRRYPGTRLAMGS
ncbi:MAG: histidine phosphatase family protein [Bacillota bacterium]